MNSILLIVNDIHFKGGGEKVASQIASWYAERGMRSCILSMSNKQETGLFQLSPKVRIDYLCVKNDLIFSKILVSVRLYKYLHANRFDFILGIGTYANILLGFLPYRKSKRIGCEHNSFDSVSIAWKLLRKIFYSQLDATVVLTEEDLPKMKQLNSCSFVIPNSISLPEKKAKLEAKTVLAIGKIYPQKGFDVMLRIFERFSRLNRDWNLIILGDGPDKKIILDLIHSLSIERRVKIMPPTNEVERFYLSSSIYLMTSRFEGLPMVLLEAQSYGLPIVSFDCKTGPKEIVIQNRNGFLIPEGDEEQVVKCLLQLCENDNLRYFMGTNAAKDANRFSPEKIYALWDRLFFLLS